MSDERAEISRAGVDEAAFSGLVESHRRELHAHCYRILGSVDDADDALQETLVAAWRGLGGFAGRSSPRTWLYRIATTRCLNMLRTRSRRPQLAPVPPFTPPEPSGSFEASWLQPYPDALLDAVDPAARTLARESVELAFVAALQALPPRQAAALVLCDVLGFSLTETAEVLDTRATAVKGLLQRARAAVPVSRRTARDEACARTAQRFADAFARDDVEAMVALLTDSAWLAMPPAPQQYDGPEAIARFLRSSARGRPGGRYHLVPVRAGGSPAFACYLAGAARGLVVVLPADGGERITGLVRFLDDDLHRRFGLPDRIDAVLT
ncbi:RNA polymerase subunit sigma-70 [Pseudokineococcus basanitobsidens]|uniref:RNA polymerase subunit sigma-70 n=1 Tax=Pseudokineococcus basanitobsidens TaxID=1926649 RepID=A0ABU8RPK8_9ACTN